MCVCVYVCVCVCVYQNARVVFKRVHKLKKKKAQFQLAEKEKNLK